MNQFTSSDGTHLPITTDADLHQRRERALAGMQAVMGTLPGDRRCPLDLHIESESDHDDIRVQTLWYSSEPDCRTPAFLVLPDEHIHAPRSAVLCLHGRNHQQGNRSVVDLSGDQPGGLACRLARRGHVVIAPCYPDMAHYPLDRTALGYRSTSLKAVWDNIRALDLLDALPQVRHGAYAAIGASMGGYNSLFTAAFDQRIQAVACGCGFDSFLDYMGGDLSVWGD
ncbi:MAG: dienelactone hydrolase family protein, partial [Planctomycetota bacterium]